MTTQVQVRQQAVKNPQQFASANHGRPAVFAEAKPIPQGKPIAAVIPARPVAATRTPTPAAQPNRPRPAPARPAAPASKPEARPAAPAMRPKPAPAPAAKPVAPPARPKPAPAPAAKPVAPAARPKPAPVEHRAQPSEPARRPQPAKPVRLDRRPNRLRSQQSGRPILPLLKGRPDVRSRSPSRKRLLRLTKRKNQSTSQTEECREVFSRGFGSAKTGTAPPAALRFPKTRMRVSESFYGSTTNYKYQRLPLCRTLRLVAASLRVQQTAADSHPDL